MKKKIEISIFTGFKDQIRDFMHYLAVSLFAMLKYRIFKVHWFPDQMWLSMHYHKFF
jgi:hypothetical protein